jgi:hypothetical protein
MRSAGMGSSARLIQSHPEGFPDHREPSGITVYVASGDSGASGGDARYITTVDFPASSRYVLGCNGTNLPRSQFPGRQLPNHVFGIH